MKKHFICTILFVCLTFFATSFATSALAEERAEDLPKLIQSYIENNQGELAAARIDFYSGVNNFVELGLPVINKAVDAGSVYIPDELVFILKNIDSSNIGLKMTATTLIASESAKFTTFGINSGAFNGKLVPKDQLDKLDKGLFLKFGDLRANKLTFAPGKVINEMGNLAQISTSVTEKNSGNTYPLILNIQKNAKGEWVVKSIENMGTLLTKALKID